MGRPLRVLIVEDRPDDAAQILAALTTGGFDSVWKRLETPDGLRAALAVDSWDIVTSAYTMAGFGAPEALSIARGADADLPFVVVSETVGEEAAVALMRAGANDYVRKHDLARLAPAIERETEAAKNRRAKRAAERSAAHWAAVVESCDDAIISKTLDGVLTSWNRAAESLYGWRADEAIGRHVSFLVPADKAGELSDILRRVAAGEKVEYFETVRLHRDGRRIDVAMTVSPVRDAAGRMVGVSKSARDIGARKRAEQARRASETQFRTLLDRIPEPLFVYDRETLGYLTVNDAAVAVYGYSRDELLAMTIRDIRPPEDVPDLVAMLMKSGSELENRGIWRHRKKDGSVFDVEITAHTVDLDDRPCCIVLARDITERRRTEAALERSESLKAAVLESALDCIVTMDAAGRIVEFNPSAERTFGFSRTESLGKTLADRLIQPASRERHLLGMEHYLATGESPMLDRRLELNAVRADGTEFPIEISITSLRIGERSHFTAFIRDLTERKRAEDERDSLLAQLNLQIERMPLAYLLSDSDSRYTRWNPAAERMFGFTEAEVLGRHPCETIVPEQSRAMVLAIFDRLAGGDMDANGICENVTKDGRVIVCEWYNTPLFEADGAFSGVLSLAQDVTAQKRASEAVAVSEVRYRRLFEAAMDGILILDPVSRLVFDANPFLAILIGYTRDELIGKELWEIGLFQDIESNKAAFRTLLKDGHIRYDDLPLRTKDGRKIDVEFVSNAYEVGGTRVIQCNIRDISERKRAQGELRLRDRAIRAASQGIVITDPTLPDNPVVYVSPGFERITGYPAGEALGRNCRFLQSPDTDPEAIARLHAAVRLGEACTVEMLNCRKDGTPFWNELSISPVHDAAERLTHFVGVQSDVTARRMLEDQFRQAQKLEAVGQLAGGIAHDFNNLLTVITGYSELLLLDLPPENPARELVGEIHRAGERSAGLTRQLLAFSRQQVLAPQILDLNAVALDTEKMLGRLIGEDIRVTTTLAPDLGRVRADPGQIEQVLMNLAVNARDAMPRGGRLTIETRNVRLDEAYAQTHAEARAGDHVLLSVADNGTGMPPDVAARIFEPFYTTKGIGKGTGLGLATVYGIVKQSGGHIAVYSEVGIGTTFKVYLPRVEEAPAPAKGRSWLQAPPRGTETILVVEDEVGVRALTRHILSGCGYTVLEAGDGDEALRVLARHTGPIHLLISDVVMPGLGGRVVAERVAELHPGVAVLFVSGYTDDAVIRHGVLQEGVNFLQKPFSAAALAIRVREVLDSPR